MLFDLKGKRRRTVQATYLILAILMGGGLVFFGIGGDVSGGLFDAFSGGPAASDNSQFEDDLTAAKQTLQTDPENEEALAEVVRSSYQLAVADADPNTGQFTDSGLARLREADEAWREYLELNPKPPDEDSVSSPGERQPDVSLATLMIQAYGPGALNDPQGAADTAGLVAQARPSANSYLLVAEAAARAGDTRKVQLAVREAQDLAEASQRKAVEQQGAQLVKEAERVAEEGQAAGGKGGADGSSGGS